MRAAIAFLAFAVCAFAQEKKDAPRIIGVAPVVLSPGSDVTLKFRGLKLDTVTEVRFPTMPDIKATIGEKKAAAIPTGLEARDVGDKEITVKVALPATLAPGTLAIEIVTPEAVLKCELLVVAPTSLAVEKEPNNGFATAQSIEKGKRLCGRIGEDKDVDVFSLNANSGERFTIDVNAARSGSLLDATVTLYDEQHHMVAQSDDVNGRDPKLTFEVKTAGRYFIVLQDANDRGDEWHGYSLIVDGTK